MSSKQAGPAAWPGVAREALRRARQALAEAGAQAVPSHAPGRSFAVNPSLRAVAVTHRGLAPHAAATDAGDAPAPEPGEEVLNSR